MLAGVSGMRFSNAGIYREGRRGATTCRNNKLSHASIMRLFYCYESRRMSEATPGHQLTYLLFLDMRSIPDPNTYVETAGFSSTGTLQSTEGNATPAICWGQGHLSALS